MFAAWSWPGGAVVNCPDGPSTSRLWDSSSVLGSLKCVVNPQASLSILNRGSSFIVAAGRAMLPAETFASVTTFCEKLEATNVSDRLPVWHSFCRQFCLLSVPSKPPVSHPRDDTTLLLFFCGRVFTLRQELELELIPHACFFALNIAKRHFSLRFLHIQSCSLQYKRLLVRLERWETPLIEDMDPFSLLRYFALRRLLCLRCICERLFRSVWWRVTWVQEVVVILSADGGGGWVQGSYATVLNLDFFMIGTCPLSRPWSTVSKDCFWFPLILQISCYQLSQCKL